MRVSQQFGRQPRVLSNSQNRVNSPRVVGRMAMRPGKQADSAAVAFCRKSSIRHAVSDTACFRRAIETPQMPPIGGSRANGNGHHHPLGACNEMPPATTSTKLWAPRSVRAHDFPSDFAPTLDLAMPGGFFDVFGFVRPLLLRMQEPKGAEVSRARFVRSCAQKELECSRLLSVPMPAR